MPVSHEYAEQCTDHVVLERRLRAGAVLAEAGERTGGDAREQVPGGDQQQILCACHDQGPEGGELKQNVELALPRMGVERSRAEGEYQQSDAEDHDPGRAGDRIDGERLAEGGQGPATRRRHTGGRNPSGTCDSGKPAHHPLPPAGLPGPEQQSEDGRGREQDLGKDVERVLVHVRHRMSVIGRAAPVRPGTPAR